MNALRLGAALFAGLASLAACGGGSDEHILPGPSTGAQPGSGGGSAASSGGPSAVGDGGAGEPASGCPQYAPDRCPSGAVSNESVCVSKQSDPTNCGSCGTSCEPQAACSAGECGSAPEQLAESKACGEVRLALGESQLIWTERESGLVRAMPSLGGAIVEIATAQLGPGQLAVDEGGVYWFNAGDGSAGSSKVMKAALPLGDAPVALVTAPGSEPITGVAVADGKLYYGLGHDVHAISTDPAQTDDVVVGVAYARNDTRMPDGVPTALAVHDGRVYWIVSDVGSVESDDLLPGTNGEPRVGHSGQLATSDLGFAGDYVYYAAFESLYAAQPGSPAVAVASSSAYSPITAFAISAVDGYFADEGGQLARHSLALPTAPTFEPTEAIPLAREQGRVTSLVLDEQHLFWASLAGDGSCTIRHLHQQ